MVNEEGWWTGGGMTEIVEKVLEVDNRVMRIKGASSGCRGRKGII
jgi:hypothetical protein